MLKQSRTLMQKPMSRSSSTDAAQVDAAARRSSADWSGPPAAADRRREEDDIRNMSRDGTDKPSRLLQGTARSRGPGGSQKHGTLARWTTTEMPAVAFFRREVE